MTHTIKITLNKFKNFSEWFDWIISEAEIYDYGRYPVKGMGIWLPYGFKIRQKVIETIRSLLDATNHEEILLPILIPETIFRKESEHVRGFEGEVLWVTHGGVEELDVKLVLRPTSETSLTYMESFWIKSYKQLPKKYYQIVSIFRYETKMTRPMMRVREVTTFKEAHTVHEDFEDAERQVLEAISIYSKFFDTLAIPYIVSRRPQWDKFAGALYTIAFDTVFPDGKAIQIGTVHNLGQTFSSVFDVKIQKRDESIDYVWQTSYGISERVIASIIAIHSDEKGLILPPTVAPWQVVIIPIQHVDQYVYKRIIEYCNNIEEMLKKEGVRVYTDSRVDVKPSEKFYEWELKGVPIRVEIGAKEVENNTVTVFRRDVMKRTNVTIDKIVENIKETLNDIQKNLYERAWKWIKDNVKIFNNIDEAIEHIRREGGLAFVPWCGYEPCVHSRIEGIEGIDALGEPLSITLNILGIESIKNLKCGFCGRDAYRYMILAKKY
ncbi:MAG: proline--tRNA ligase [Ignisphaera sp.]